METRLIEELRQMGRESLSAWANCQVIGQGNNSLAVRSKRALAKAVGCMQWAMGGMDCRPGGMPVRRQWQLGGLLPFVRLPERCRESAWAASTCHRGLALEPKGTPQEPAGRGGPPNDRGPSRNTGNTGRRGAGAELPSLPGQPHGASRLPVGSRPRLAHWLG